MLEYSKQILKKVSFDRFLFEKELVKAKSLLIQEELAEFKNWCMHQFGEPYLTIIEKHF